MKCSLNNMDIDLDDLVFLDIYFLIKYIVKENPEYICSDEELDRAQEFLDAIHDPIFGRRPHE